MGFLPGQVNRTVHLSTACGKRARLSPPSGGAFQTDDSFRPHPEERPKAASRRMGGPGGLMVRNAPLTRRSSPWGTGDPAQPPAGIKTGCPMRAALGNDEGSGGAAPDRGPERGLRLCPEARCRGRKSPHVERREAPRVPIARARGDAFARCPRACPAGRPMGVSQTPASAGAPLPSGSRDFQFRLRRTRRRPKNTGDGARLPVIPGREPKARPRASSTRYGANLESRNKHRASFWIPGSALRAAPE